MKIKTKNPKTPGVDHLSRNNKDTKE